MTSPINEDDYNPIELYGTDELIVELSRRRMEFIFCMFMDNNNKPEHNGPVETCFICNGNFKSLANLATFSSEIIHEQIERQEEEEENDEFY